MPVGFKHVSDFRRMNRGIRKIEQIKLRARSVRMPRAVAATGGGSSCEWQNCKLQLHVFGSPTAGSFSFDLTANGATESITINYDDTAAEIDTALQTHSGISSGDVLVSFGPLPDAAVEIEFTGSLANTDIPVPAADWNSLTGTGLGVLFSKTQLGFPY